MVDHMKCAVSFVVCFVVAIFAVAAAGAQSFTVSTDRPSYEHGDSIVVRATLLNDTEQGLGIVFGSVSPNCQAAFVIGGKNVAEHNGIMCVGTDEEISVGRGQGLTWQIAVDPGATGLPVVEGLQAISASLKGWWGTFSSPGEQFTLVAEPTYIHAPRSSGGTMVVAFPLSYDESWLDPIRDSLHVTVLSRSSWADMVTETWRLSGVWVFDAEERLREDPRFRYVQIMYEIPVDRREALPGEGVGIAGHWMLEEGTLDGSPLVEPAWSGRTVVVFTRHPQAGTDAYLLYGHTGCSDFRGSYRTTDNTLHAEVDSVAGVFTCAGEDRILRAIAEDWADEASFSIESGRLHIDFGEDRMTFAPLHSEPDPRLREAGWAFREAYLDGRMIDLAGPRRISGELDFEPDLGDWLPWRSTGHAYTGNFCNWIEGTYWTGPGNRLIAQGELTSLVSCPENEDLERLDGFQFWGMRDGATYAIQDGVLTIEMGDDFVRFAGRIPDTTAVERYLPLAVGNTWVFRYGETLPTFDTFSHAGYRRYTVVGDTTLHVSGPAGTVQRRYYRITSECFDTERRAEDVSERDHLVRLAVPAGMLLMYDSHDGTERPWSGFSDHLMDGLPCGLNVSFPHPDLRGGYSLHCGMYQAAILTSISGGYDREPSGPLQHTTSVKAFYYPYTGVEFAGDVGMVRSRFEHQGGSELVLEHAVIDGVEYGAPVVGLSANDLPGVMADFVLHGNHPNPFHPRTAVEFTLGRPAEIGLAVYDLLGRRLITVEPRLYEAGSRQQIVIDGAGLASGVYFFQMTSRQGEVVGAGRMVVVR
jgi:hypothetical protein